MEQFDLFGGMEAREKEDEVLARERRIQEAVLGIWGSGAGTGRTRS